MGNIEKDIYKGQPLTFGTWIAYAFPEMLLCLLLTWIYLQIYYLPLPFRYLARTLQCVIYEGLN
jgi:di/tricarboxylate transporter